MSSTVKTSNAYMALFKRFPLRPIRDDSTLDAASDVFSELVMKGDRLTTDEADYVEILGKIIAEYEERNRRSSRVMTPQRALESLMEDNNLSQSELARSIEAPQSVISEFLAGKRGLSKTLVVKLSNHFKVSAELFLPKRS